MNITPLKEIQRNNGVNLQEMIETKEQQSSQKDRKKLNLFNLQLNPVESSMTELRTNHPDDEPDVNLRFNLNPIEIVGNSNLNSKNNL